jgi:lipid A 4'-phosphatase
LQHKVVMQLLVSTLALHLMFAVWPQIDIAVSRWFYLGNGRFWLAGHATSETMRHIIWAASLVVAALALAMLCCTATLGQRARSPWRFWAFVVALYVLGPGVLVNFVLKQHWGRARPTDVAEFGGVRQFTPPFEMTDQCLRNCSFVSGEVAAATVLALVLGLVLLDRARPWRRNLWLVGLIALFAMVAFQRVASGRHFLSDVVFAAMFMLVMARVLFAALQARACLGPGLMAAMRADVGLVLQPVTLGDVSFAAGAKEHALRAHTADDPGHGLQPK